ncbi:MAG: antibiotic biosynthesis monooxygenase family protein [Janthinobacterium lividum]
MKNPIVDLIFAFTVKAENQALYEQTLAQQLAITANEPHVLGYEIFRQADGSYCQHERYADEAAIRLHTQNTAVPLKVWGEITEITHMTALGPLSDEFKQEFGMDNYLPYAAVAK